MKIPTIGESALNTDGIPGVDINPGSFGATEQAIASLGDKGFQFAAELMAKRKDAEAKDFAFSSTMEDQRALTVQMHELKLKDPTNYAKPLQEWADERFKSTQERAPTEQAKRLYQQHSGERFNSSVTMALADEFKEKALNFQKNILDDGERDANLLMSFPSVDKAVEYFAYQKQRLNDATGTILNKIEVIAVEEQIKNKIAHGLLEGFYNKGQSATSDAQAGAFYQQGLDILHGKSAKMSGGGLEVTGSLLDKLDPADKVTFLNKFTTAIKARHQTQLIEHGERFRDQITQLENGAPLDSGYLAARKLDAMKKAIPVDTYVREAAEFNSAYAYGQMRKQLATTPVAEIPALFASWDSRLQLANDSFAKKNPEAAAIRQPGFNAATSQHYKNRLLNEAQSLEGERLRDPSAYVQQFFPDVREKAKMAENADPRIAAGRFREYASSVIAKQEFMGVPKNLQRLTSKPQASMLGAMLSGKNEQQVAQVFSQLEQKYGDNFSRVFSEVAADGRVDKALWVAHSIPDSLDRQKVIGSVINEGHINDGFKDYKDKQAFEVAVNEQIADKFTALARTSANGGSLEHANAIKKIVMLEGKKLLIGDPSMDIEDAAAKAVGIIDKTFGLASDGNKSLVLYPRVINGKPVNTRLIEAFMESSLEPEGLNELKVAYPPDGKPEEFQRLIKQTGHWVLNNTRDGIRLEVVTPRGHELVRTKDNKVLEYRFSDLAFNPSPRTLKAAQPALKRFLEKLVP